MKFCLLVVLYNPSEQDLQRLAGYVTSGFFEHIMAWDNSTSSHKTQIPIGMEYVSTVRDK